MGLQDLADVHPRGHAERIEHNVDWSPVRHVRHVLDRRDLGDNALVAVATGHLVARLQPALDGQIHLDHLLHARRQFVAAGQFALLFLEGSVERLARLLQARLQLLELLGGLLIGQADIEPVIAFDILQVGFGNLGALRQLLGPAVGGLAGQQALDTTECVVLDDAQLIREVRLVPLEFIVDDLSSTLVAFDALAREDLHVDHRAGHARRHAQRGVLHIGGLLAEDRSQQLFFRRELGLTLGRDLAHKHVARLDFGTYRDDARLVQSRQHCLPTSWRYRA